VPGSGRLIAPGFFLRPVQEVAPDLLGRHLCRDGVALRITEVEAYAGPEDSASHCRYGRTRRNAPMWEAGGLAYLYFCYGMHHMLNIVTGPADRGEAVLVRSCEVVRGLEQVRLRRGGLDGPVLLTGPGKVAQALDLDLGFSGHPLFRRGGLELRLGDPGGAILCGPRVGIDFAHPEHRDRPWRFAQAGTPWVSRRRELGPWNGPDPDRR
jgi:DNA-3-methyladenine glycosylase